MDINMILSMSCVQLKEKLRSLNLNVSGRKDELRNRLLEHYQLSTIDESEDDEIEQFDDPRTNGHSPKLSEASTQIISHFTLKDVEDSLTTFNGTDAVGISRWIQEIEDVAITIGWNELQCFIFGKQLLKGAARLYIRGKSGVNNWQRLKQELKDEFEKTISTAETHEILRNKRKNKNESMLEFLYTIIEIGKTIALDEKSIVEYFVEGIPDSKQNKLVLYQATDVKKLKEAIQVYNKVRGHGQSLNRHDGQTEVLRGFPKPEMKREKVFQKRCFNCGESTHLAKDCQQQQVKCFKCNKWGHRSFECQQVSRPALPKTELQARPSNVNMMTNEVKNVMLSQLIFKTIVIDNHIVDAIIDTGCIVSLIRYDELMMLDDRIMLKEDKIELVGIGKTGFTTLGSFVTTVRADGLSFNMQFHVVAERDLTYSVIIGKNILSKVDLMITQGKTRFVRRQEMLEPVLKAGVAANRVKIEPTKVLEVETTREIVKRPVDAKRWCWVAENLESIHQDEVLELTHLNREYMQKIREIVMTYKPNKIKSVPVTMKLILTDDIPVRQRVRRLSYSEQKIVDEQITKWLKDGIIRPSLSEYASPVVLVDKKDGTHRLCCDYRQINKKIIKDNFPMPLIEEVIERLVSAQVFTTLDLANGFFHVAVEEESIKYTSFVVKNGQYEFLRVPFGITNSPAVFNRYVMVVFKDMIDDDTIVVYMDDIIIPSQDENEGIEKLISVLSRAASYGLEIKWKKCQMLQRRVNFLGYIVEAGTLKPSEAKTAAIKNYPLPMTTKALQRFLGLTSYFRRFIENYAVIAKPLSDLLRKDVNYELNDEQLAAFEQLKLSLMKAPVLRIYNPLAETEIHTDASQFGYGGVLLQKCADDSLLHPVQYMSRKTKPAEEKYHSYELEVLAIIEALKKWRHYVLGKPVKIVTDCNAFQMTMQKTDVPLRVSRWAMFLQDYDYVIEHRSGSKMRHVDALSRVACLLIEQNLHDRLVEAQKTDDWVKLVRKILENSEYEDFYLRKGVLYKDPTKELIVVPKEMEESIIQIAHRQGHFAVKKTCELIEKSFYITQMGSKVTKFIKNCIECIIINEKTGKREGYVFPLDKEDIPLTTLHLDHVGPMEATKKSYNYLLVIVDAFSKFVWLYPTKNTGAEGVITCMQRQAAVFGNPRRVVTDRGAAFTSNAFKHYCEEQQIVHLLITTGVPRANGQVERMHRIIIPMLAKLSHDCPSKWYKFVDKVQQAINNTPSRSTKHTPFKLLTGVEMRLVGLPELREMLRNDAEQQLEDERTVIRNEAKQNIQKIQCENKRNANAKRRVAEQYVVGDLVAIKRTQFGTGLRLRPRFLGPYRVTAVHPHDRYEVVKVGEHEGPINTRTVVEHMKRWH